MGDPAGIGPEISKKAARHPWVKKNCHLHLFGDFSLVKPAVPPPSRLKARRQFLEQAVRRALSGRIDALVTCPLPKFKFQNKVIGHTEYIQYLTKAKKTALMMVHDTLRAVHVTSHIPLRDVSKKITKKRLLEVIHLTRQGANDLGIKNPRILVCGLNPHAGEHGQLGREENLQIRPAVRHAQKQGVRVEGPASADVVWPQVKGGLYDVGIAMYHDQGQIPVKLSGFSPSKKKGRFAVSGVNLTLGLPIIRTSVNHGTAYDIAGKGIAAPNSPLDAIKLAVQMVRRRKLKIGYR